MATWYHCRPRKVRSRRTRACRWPRRGWTCPRRLTRSRCPWSDIWEYQNYRSPSEISLHLAISGAMKPTVPENETLAWPVLSRYFARPKSISLIWKLSEVYFVVSLHIYDLWHSKASEFKSFSIGLQLSAGFWSQTVTVGNWISSIGAFIVSNVVITGSWDHWVKAWFIINPAIMKPHNVIVA